VSLFFLISENIVARIPEILKRVYEILNYKHSMIKETD